MRQRCLFAAFRVCAPVGVHTPAGTNEPKCASEAALLLKGGRKTGRLWGGFNMLLYPSGSCTVESQCMRRAESHQPALQRDGGGGGLDG